MSLHEALKNLEEDPILILLRSLLLLLLVVVDINKKIKIETLSCKFFLSLSRNPKESKIFRHIHSLVGLWFLFVKLFSYFMHRLCGVVIQRHFLVSKGEEVNCFSFFIKKARIQFHICIFILYYYWFIKEFDICN